MKKIVTAMMLTAIASATMAADSTTCGLVIDYPPGGTSDSYVRLLQKQNSGIHIDYKAGGGGALAINHISQNKDVAWFGSPVFVSQNSPVKDPPVELVRILVGSPILALSNPNKSLTWDKLLTGKMNIGFPAIGTSHHLVALQLQEKNPNIQLISAGGDNKALPMLMNGDLDLYLISNTVGKNWIQDFKFDNLFTLAYNKPVTHSGIELNYLGFNGIFVHKEATPEQKSRITKCVAEATSNPAWAETLKTMGAEPIDLVGPEKDRAFQKFVNLMRKYGQ